MTELILTRGLPASGKSTWASAWVQEDPDNRVRVNRDDLRHMLFGKYWGVDEDTVSAAEESLVRNALKRGKDVVIDATHLKAAFVKKWARIHPVTLKEFEAPLEDLIHRDLERRIAGGRGVGSGVIQDLARRFHIGTDGRLPNIDLSDVQPVEGFQPYEPGPVRAYSFDIDGTLAHMQGRSPYDPTRYHEDLPDVALSEILWALQDQAARNGEEVAFLGLSGRSEDHREATEEWLQGWGFRLDALFMRPSGDERNDAIIKSELVDQHISNVYDVVAHFDDRDRVVNALRAKGLKVLQVAEGNF